MPLPIWCPPHKRAQAGSPKALFYLQNTGYPAYRHILPAPRLHRRAVCNDYGALFYFGELVLKNGGGIYDSHGNNGNAFLTLCSPMCGFPALPVTLPKRKWRKYLFSPLGAQFTMARELRFLASILNFPIIHSAIMSGMDKIRKRIKRRFPLKSGVSPLQKIRGGQRRAGKRLFRHMEQLYGAFARRQKRY